MSEKIIEKAVNAFYEKFGEEGPLSLSVAPGRVNLIGEHTDYNEGFVMPMAIDRAIAIAFRPSDDNRVELFDAVLGCHSSFDADSPAHSDEHPWLNYPQGVAWAMSEAGYRPRGFQGVIAGNVPQGAGLSSSAAFEASSALVFRALGGYIIPGPEMARICQRAENEFVGMRCGIMDQFVSLMAEEKSALLLDCRSLEHRPVRLLPESATVMLFDTGVRRELVGSEYNRRREECEKAVATIAKSEPNVKSLRDVNVETLAEHAGALEGKLLMRARHVVTENQRVLDAADALQRGDIAAFGELVNGSHDSLRDDYEVSCRELDIMVELARAQEGTLGARMIGGGFGGCAMAVVKNERVEEVRRAVTDGYKQACGIIADSWVFEPAGGARVERIHD